MDAAIVNWSGTATATRQVQAIPELYQPQLNARERKFNDGELFAPLYLHNKQ